MKCPNCGKEIANDSKFCEFCGTKIKTKKSKILWWIIGIMALLFILLLCVFSNSTDSSYERDVSVMVSDTLVDTTTEISNIVESVEIAEPAEYAEIARNSPNEMHVPQQSINSQQKPEQQPQQKPQQITSTTQQEEFVDENNDEVYVTVEDRPKFPGGDVALMQYLRENIKYPIIAQENGTQGRVICQFVVEKDGSIVDINVVRSVDPSLDKEAIRVIRSMPKWKPGMQGGKVVRTRFTMPIAFRLQ